MEISEIKVSYSNSSTSKVKIANSKTVYETVLSCWDLETIEYQEVVKLLLLNRANVVLGIYELSKGAKFGQSIPLTSEQSEPSMPDESEHSLPDESEPLKIVSI